MLTPRPGPRGLAAALIVLTAAPALAQDAPRDWDISRDARKKVILASVVFDSGLGIAVRCVNRSYEAVLVGLPNIDAETRTLRVAFGDDEMHDQSWDVATDDTVAVSPWPAPFARQLREGGRLQIVAPGAAEGGRNLRYVLDLPASGAAIDETLTACNRPVVDPRDAELEALGDTGLPLDITWLRRPRPRYPVTRYAKGFATVTCMTQPDGRTRDCVVETEHPRDGGFGEAALDATRAARLQNTLDPQAALPIGRIAFRTNFYMEGYEPRGTRRRPPVTGTRIPD